MTTFLFATEFETYIRTEKRFSEHTVSAYKNDLLQFFEFVSVFDTSELVEINSSVIRGWLVYLAEQKYSNTSIHRKLSSLRTYFRFLKRNNIVEINPASNLNSPKIKKRLPQFAQEADLKNVDPMTTLPIREALIVELLYQTGIRLNELIELTTESIYNNSIKVKGKRNKERIVPISQKLSQQIELYRQQCAEQGFCNRSLILTDKGNKLYPTFVYRTVNAYLRIATELHKCSPHVLRHTFATHMLNNGAGIETIKNLLGHASLAATQVYTHNSFAQLTNVYSQAHPRGRKKSS